MPIVICVVNAHALSVCASVMLSIVPVRPGRHTPRKGSDLFASNGDFDGAAMGLRRKVCSSCAVEGLTEAGTEIVRCLDCVQGNSASGWTLDEMNHEMMRG
jgi:hypothetical protein